MLSLAAIPIGFKFGDAGRIPENPNPAAALARDLYARASTAETDPRVKPGAPTAVPCLLFSQEVITA
jgi:hypothetical protein